MNSTVSSQPCQVDGPVTVSLQDFFTHVRHSNPFEANRISSPDQFSTDVSEIHAKAFRELSQLANRARHDRTGIGVVVWGEAGIGKSHLLARLCRRSGEEACFAFLHNLQTRPDRLLGYVLKCVINRLAEPRNGDYRASLLFKFLERAVTMATPVVAAGVQSRRVGDATFQRLHEAIVAANPCATGDDHQHTCRVLVSYYLAVTSSKESNDRHEQIARLAFRWLAGDYLDPEEATLLRTSSRIPPDATPGLADNQAVESVLMAIGELARLSNQTFLLVFDQVDNLSPEQVGALARLSHSLIDHVRNLLLITSGVQCKILEYTENDVIDASAWDRISREKITLSRIRAAEAQRLIHERLSEFFSGYVYSLPIIREKIRTDLLFPLGSEWLHSRLDGAEFRPRDVINWAHQRWKLQCELQDELGPRKWLETWPQRTDHIASTTATIMSSENSLAATISRCEPTECNLLIDREVAGKLEEQRNRRKLDRGSLPADAGNMAGLTRQLLMQCLDANNGYSIRAVRAVESTKSRSAAYDLMVEEESPTGKLQRTGVTFLATGQKQTMTAALKRIAGDPQPPDHVLIVTEERQPLQLGEVGKRLQDELSRRGEEAFQTMQLNFDDYALLDALQAVVGEACSGDLELDVPMGNHVALTPAEVIASHHRCDRYREHVLLRELLTEEPAAGVPVKASEHLDEDKLVQYIVAQLALTMGASTIELAVKYDAEYSGQIQGGSSRTRIETVAANLHQRGIINATPQDDHLFLLYRQPARNVL